MPPRGRSDPGSGSGPPRYPGSFLLAFRQGVEKIGWKFQRLSRDVAHCIDDGGQVHQVGVENLYRRARRAPREEWSELIVEFLRTVSSAEQAENLPLALEAAADQLLVRLGHPLRLADEDARVWAQDIPGTDLVMNLVVDYPNRMCYVTERLVADSGRPGGEWLERARANLLARTPPDCFQLVHEESGLRLCSVADAYDSSRALLLDHILPQARAEGYLAVLPGRDELLVMPVTLQSIPHVHLMKVLADKNYHSAPYPISNEVYWIYEGTWRRFLIDIQTDKVTVQPPPEFVEVLNRLGAGEKEKPGEEK